MVLFGSVRLNFHIKTLDFLSTIIICEIWRTITSLSSSLLIVSQQKTNKQKKLNIAVLQEKCVDFNEKYIACKDKEQVKTKALIR